MSFHWQGRNKQGVSKWRGSWIAPPRWFGLTFFGYGLLAGSAGLCGLLYALSTGKFEHGFMTLVSVGLIHGLVFGGTGAWMLAMRRRILSLSPPEQVCHTLGLDESALEKVVEERGIKPRIIINEQPYYDLSDFTDAARLLRASSAPTPPDTLLRPAAHSETASDLLLRASDAKPQNKNREGK